LFLDFCEIIALRVHEFAPLLIQILRIFCHSALEGFSPGSFKSVGAPTPLRLFVV